MPEPHDPARLGEFVLLEHPTGAAECAAVDRMTLFLLTHADAAFAGAGPEPGLDDLGLEARGLKTARRVLFRRGALESIGVTAAQIAEPGDVSRRAAEWVLRLGEAGLWGAWLEAHADDPEAARRGSASGSDAGVFLRGGGPGGRAPDAGFRHVRRRFPAMALAGPARPIAGEGPVPAFARALPLPAGPGARGGHFAGVARRRLLMVIPWMTLGGADRFNLDVIERLTGASDGGAWDVTVVSTLAERHEWLGEFQRRTPEVFPLHRFARPAEHPRVLRALVESRRPDVVLVSNSELGYALLPYLRAFCPAPAYADYNHMEEEDWNDGGHPRAGVEAQPHLDLSIVASEHLKGWMVRHGADASRIEVCRVHVDPDRWARQEASRERVRRELGVEGPRPVVLYAARLCEQKRPLLLAEALGELARRGREFMAVVAGDGPDRAALERSVREMGLLPRVRLLGGVDPDRMPGVYAAADVLLLPSKWEGIALCVYEAMAAGVPVVCSDVGGQRELVAPGCGVLVPADAGAAAYAEALERVLDDDAARTAMVERARARVAASFRLDQMGVRMHELLERAIELRRSRPRAPVGEAEGVAAATRAIERFGLGARQVVGVPPAWSPQQRRAWDTLRRVARSPAWRALDWVKSTRAHAAWARAVHGPRGADHAESGDPIATLERLRRGRTARWLTRAGLLPA